MQLDLINAVTLTDGVKQANKFEIAQRALINSLFKRLEVIAIMVALAK